MKKNHSSDPAPLSLADVLEENKMLNWIVENGRTLLWLLLGALIVAIAIYKMAFAGAEKSEYAFINAENDYQLFLANNQAESLQKLDALMALHPELHAKYDALIAQNLLSQGKTEQALPYATPSLKRTAQENSPFYSAYAQTSLLIAEKNYDEALSQAVALKQLMEKEASTLLYGLNLIRIGMLQHQLGLKKDEAELWKEWKKYAALSQNALEFKSLMYYFQEGKISLTNYIEAREKALEKN